MIPSTLVGEVVERSEVDEGDPIPLDERVIFQKEWTDRSSVHGLSLDVNPTKKELPDKPPPEFTVGNPEETAYPIGKLVGDHSRNRRPRAIVLDTIARRQKTIP